ncbi:MAG: hypothetical protein MJ170_00925 [Alphaproteobacteria bacterium]|nr:hypothetical protein [Alphaproteobacteria bacterium]
MNSTYNYYHGISLDDEKVKELLSKDIKTLSNKEKKLFFGIKKALKRRNQKTYELKRYILKEFGYNIHFVGYKDPKTNKVLSFYSNQYAKQKGRPCKFKNQDNYFNKLRYIQNNFDNYGFIQQEYSRVLWIDLDCHEESLKDQYTKIQSAFINSFRNNSVYENKNNGMGTHMWIFCDKDMTSKQRRMVQKYLQNVASQLLKIELPVCQKIIDMPKAWFRVPGTLQYRKSYYSEYDVYEAFSDAILTLKQNSLSIDESIFEERHTVSQSNHPQKHTEDNKAQKEASAITNGQSNIEIGQKIFSQGLSRGNSYEELSQLVPYIIHQEKQKNPNISDFMSNVPEIVNTIKKLGGNADILSNTDQLTSQVEYLVKGLKINKREFVEEVKDWHDYLPDVNKTDVLLAEKFAINYFLNEYNKKARKHKLSEDNINDIVNNFFNNYIKIQDSTKYNNLCGNLGTVYINRIINISGETTGIVRKINAFISNLYGLYLVIDQQGNYYIPGVMCARFVILDSNYNCILGKNIFNIVAQNILNFSNVIKYTRIKDLQVLKTVIVSFKENIDCFRPAGEIDTINYEITRKNVVKEIHPEIYDRPAYR